MLAGESVWLNFSKMQVIKDRFLPSFGLVNARYLVFLLPCNKLQKSNEQNYLEGPEVVLLLFV